MRHGYCRTIPSSWLSIPAVEVWRAGACQSPCSLRYSDWQKVAEMEKHMRLYEFAPTRSIRARWTLQELGVDFESVVINLVAGDHRRPEFLKINPAGRVPVLVDDDLVLTESVAIVLYLAEKYPHKGLMPAAMQRRAQLYRWLLFVATELEQ